MESSIPEVIVYADDCDFITEIEKTKDKIYEKAKEIAKNKTLLVNEDKTEYTIKRRGKRMEKYDKTGIKAW